LEASKQNQETNSLLEAENYLKKDTRICIAAFAFPTPSVRAEKDDSAINPP